MNRIKKIGVEAVLNFSVFILPVVIISKILVDSVFLGCVAGLLFFYMLCPRYIIRVDKFIKKPCKKE